jgi:hypothetical protein
MNVNLERIIWNGAEDTQGQGWLGNEGVGLRTVYIFELWWVMNDEKVKEMGQMHRRAQSLLLVEGTVWTARE